MSLFAGLGNENPAWDWLGSNQYEGWWCALDAQPNESSRDQRKKNGPFPVARTPLQADNITRPWVPTDGGATRHPSRLETKPPTHAALSAMRTANHEQEGKMQERAKQGPPAAAASCVMTPLMEIQVTNENKTPEPVYLLPCRNIYSTKTTPLAGTALLFLNVLRPTNSGGILRHDRDVDFFFLRAL